MKIALLANKRKNAPTWPGMSPDHWDDLDSEETIDAIMGALEKSGHSATYMEADTSLADRLRKERPDLCFNIAEGHFADSREAQIPALLEMLETMRLTVMKNMSKGLPDHPYLEDVIEDLNRVKWYLWHGNAYQALETLGIIERRLEGFETDDGSVAKNTGVR